MPDDHNALILVETGTSPRKVADGPGHSELKFRRGRGFSEQTVRITIDGESGEEMFPIEDLYWQAATRGGRMVDKIIGKKAEFRSTTTSVGNFAADIGNTAVVISPLLSSSSNLGTIGGAVGLVGVTSMAIGQSSRPRADTRYWDSIPDAFHIYTTRLEPGDHEMMFEFLDVQGNVVEDKTIEQSITKQAGKGLFVWIPSPSM